MAELVFYHGAMNSGKSAQLIMQVHELKERGNTVDIFKSELDERDVGSVHSRALIETYRVIPIPENVVGSMIDKVAIRKPDYVFVDEVNFLTEAQIDELSRIVDELNVPVYAYGITVDFQSKIFAGSKRLMEIADTVREITSQCHRKDCRNKANQNMRLVNGQPTFIGEQIQVGGEEDYITLCRKCYMEEKKRFIDKQNAK